MAVRKGALEGRKNVREQQGEALTVNQRSKAVAMPISTIESRMHGLERGTAARKDVRCHAGCGKHDDKVIGFAWLVRESQTALIASNILPPLQVVPMLVTVLTTFSTSATISS